MKKQIYWGFTLFLLYTINLAACPTCIGRLEKHAPPFFSDEKNTYYQEEAATLEAALAATQKEAQNSDEE